MLDAYVHRDQLILANVGTVHGKVLTVIAIAPLLVFSLFLIGIHFQIDSFD